MASLNTWSAFCSWPCTAGPQPMTSAVFAMVCLLCHSLNVVPQPAAQASLARPRCSVQRWRPRRKPPSEAQNDHSLATLPSLLLGNAPAAIDDQVGARDVRGVVGGQEADGRGDFVGPAEPP